jgi:hypothetical protein
LGFAPRWGKLLSVLTRHELPSDAASSSPSQGTTAPGTRRTPEPTETPLLAIAILRMDREDAPIEATDGELQEAEHARFFLGLRGVPMNFPATAPRGARGLLGWSQTALANAAGLSEPTIKRFETCRGARVSEDAVAKIVAALESAGVEFIAENGGGAGVRLRKGG